MQTATPASSFIARLCATVALLCAAITAASAAAPQKELAIAVAPAPPSLPLYVAESQGYFAEEGLKLRWLECRSGVRCMELMLGGEADLATAADAAVMFRSFERNDYAVLGTLAKIPDDLKLVARRSAGITTARNLVGKRIGTVLRSSSHYFLDAFLLLNGIDPHSAFIVGLAPEDMVDALADGRVDAVSVWEPMGFQAWTRLKNDAVLLHDPEVYNASFNLLASRRITGSRDADLAKLLRAIGRAQRFIAARPLDAQAILRARLGMDQASVDWIWKSAQYSLTLDQSLLRTLEAEARWAQREGHVLGKRTPNYLKFIHAAPLRSVDDDAVSLPR